MSIELSQRVQSIKPSATLTIAAKAQEMRASGTNVISMSVGEPDFGIPEHIKQAAVQAIQDGYNKYTPVDGLPSLKQAIIDKFARENQLKYEANQILVSTGAKQNLYNAFQALLNPGDEVIIPAPYWVSYPAMALLADAKPIVIDTDISQSFKITAEQLRAAITPKTRLFVLNSPSNPSGMTYSNEELSALAEVLLEHPQIVVLSDDIYEHIIWEGQFSNILNVCPDLYDRTIVVNGVSKAFSMTGWRIGYSAASPAITAAMKKIQGQSTSNANVIAQLAAQAALKGGLDCVSEMVVAFKRRHDLVVNGLNEIAGFKVLPVTGTFYAFPDVSEAMKNAGFDNDVDFAAFLLNEAKVATVPGSAFGCDGYLRLSYATDDDSLRTALSQIKTALEAIDQKVTD